MNVSAGHRARIRAQDAITDNLESMLIELGNSIEDRLRVLLRPDASTSTDMLPFDVAVSSVQSIADNPAAVRAAMLLVELGEIETWLDALGLENARREFFGGFSKLSGPIAQALTDAGIPNATTLFDREGVRVAVAAFKDRLDGAMFDPLRRTSASRVAEAIQANAELLTDNEFAARIGDAYEVGLPAAKTEAVTRLASADRFIHEQLVREAESDADDDGGFLRGYAGPFDGRTRPFCAALTGKAFSLGELERANNGQTGNPIDDCGGYNCRHMLELVIEDLIEDSGFTRGTPADIAQASNAARSARKGKRRRKAAA